MTRLITLRDRRERKRKQRAVRKFLLSLGVFAAMLAIMIRLQYGNAFENIRYETCFSLFQYISPALARENVLCEDSETDYGTSTQSAIAYEAILAEETDEGTVDSSGGQTTDTALPQTTVEGQSESTIALEKLNDFDYLLQKCYVVDKTTTITPQQLNASELLAKDCTLKGDASKPQILIYHTHSQEGYSDSVEGDEYTSVVGVGDVLTDILTRKYGYQVIHHKGQYDVNDRDHAYSNAAPAIQEILAENPSIEVVIDLHRDGVPEGTRLVTEENGTPMAQIMFFNGLSRTTAVGDIDYLYNPYIEDNLAFSLKMQLAAMNTYPGFSRHIYLKGYRYNMHFCPKSLLVEVGAQTNTVQEAKNAMVPLADILHQVLSGK